MAKKSDLIIDVGSGSVGACLVEYADKPSLSFVKRLPIGTGSQETREHITEAVNQTLKAVLSIYQKASVGSVKIVLASPWYDAKIASIVTKSEKPMKVSPSTVARSVKNYRAKQRTGAPVAGRSPIESVITQVAVNGYATALKKNVWGVSLRVTIYESEADAAFLKMILDAVHAVFPHVTVAFHTFPLLTFIILRDLRDEQSFVFVDAGGEITDVGVVFRDSFAFLASFPMGSGNLIRNLSDPQKGIADGASRLSLYVREELSMEEQAVFAPAFQKSAKEWNDALEALLEHARNEVPVPQTTFVAADKEELKWFGRVLTDTHENAPLRSILLTPDFFQDKILLGDDALYDAFMSLEALFFHLKPNLTKV